jgi:hypothetical protein
VTGETAATETLRPISISNHGGALEALAWLGIPNQVQRDYEKIYLDAGRRRGTTSRMVVLGDCHRLGIYGASRSQACILVVVNLLGREEKGLSIPFGDMTKGVLGK